MSPIEEQLRTILGHSIVNLAIGIVTTAIGLFAIAGHLRRGRSKSRLLLWFGLFAGLYGIRALSRALAFRVLFEVPASSWDFVGAVIDNIILVPAFLFWDEIYGKGWKSSARWLIWGSAVYGAIALTLSALFRRPYVLPEPGGLVLLIVGPLLICNYLAGYRPPPFPELKTLIVGFGVFVVFVINSHLGRWEIFMGRSQLEPIGFFFFLCCVGWIAVNRFRANELQLLALEEELKAARRIQESILPSSIPELPGLEVAVCYAPMTAVAGDFYDFLSTGARRLGVLVADVAGHGVPAALGAAMIKVAVSIQAENASDPAQLIAGLNDTMHRQAHGQFTTAAFLDIDLRAGVGTYSAAGHPPLLQWKKTSQSICEFSENGLLLGVLPNQDYVNTRFEIASGDRLILCTDGVWEAENREQQTFGEIRFREFIREHGNLGANGIATSLLGEVNEWSTVNRGMRQSDDITIVVLGVN